MQFYSGIPGSYKSDRLAGLGRPVTVEPRSAHIGHYISVVLESSSINPSWRPNNPAAMLQNRRPLSRSPSVLLQLPKPNLLFPHFRLNRRPELTYLSILPNPELGLVNGHLQRISQV